MRLTYSPRTASNEKEITRNKAYTPTSSPGKDTCIGRRNSASYSFSTLEIFTVSESLQLTLINICRRRLFEQVSIPKYIHHRPINAKAYAHTKNGAGSGSPHNALHSLVYWCGFTLVFCNLHCIYISIVRFRPRGQFIPGAKWTRWPPFA